MAPKTRQDGHKTAPRLLLAALGLLLAALRWLMVALEPLLAALGPLLAPLGSLLVALGPLLGRSKQAVLNSPGATLSSGRASYLSIGPKMGLVLLDPLPRRPNHDLTLLVSPVSNALRCRFRYLFDQIEN